MEVSRFNEESLGGLLSMMLAYPPWPRALLTRRPEARNGFGFTAISSAKTTQSLHSRFVTPRADGVLAPVPVVKPLTVTNLVFMRAVVLRQLRSCTRSRHVLPRCRCA